jgi:hypothetical protein
MSWNTLKAGDLIKFSGEYYEALSDERIGWVASKKSRQGLIIQIENIQNAQGENTFAAPRSCTRVWILSDTKRFYIDCEESKTNCNIELISEIEVGK